MAQQIDFEKFNPFRRPDWRMDRVLQMVDRMPNPGRSTKRDDDYVKGLRNFMLRYRAYDDAARNQLGYENPGLFWAYQIHDRREDDGKRKAIMVEARILAGQTDEQIADELGTVPGVVHWYEKVFFNVRDRLKNHDWVIDHVLMPAWEAEHLDEEEDEVNPAHVAFKQVSRPYFDCTTKFFAYFGGVFCLDYVLSGFRRGNQVMEREGVGEWMDNNYIDRLRHRSNMAMHTFEPNRYQIMQLFELNNQIIQIERNKDAALQAKDNFHKAVQAMLTSMDWAVGDEGNKLVEGTLVQKYDESAVELRDDEVLLLSAGRKPDKIEGIETFKLPPPRPRGNAGQEDQQHANAQQGS